MRYLLYVPAFGWNAIAWLLIFLAGISTKARFKWQKPPGKNDLPGLWAIMPVNSWIVRAFRLFMKRWGAITLGHGGLIAADAADNPATPEDDWTTTEDHEAIHIEQFEAIAVAALAVAGFVLYRTGDYWTAQTIWSSPWLLFVGSGTLTALLRGENPYRGAHHEEAAYKGQGRGHGGH